MCVICLDIVESWAQKYKKFVNAVPFYAENINVY